MAEPCAACARRQVCDLRDDLLRGATLPARDGVQAHVVIRRCEAFEPLPARASTRLLPLAAAGLAAAGGGILAAIGLAGTFGAGDTVYIHTDAKGLTFNKEPFEEEKEKKEVKPKPPSENKKPRAKKAAPKPADKKEEKEPPKPENKKDTEEK